MRAVASTLVILTVLGVGCATPRTVEGRKVIHTTWQDGHAVYRVQDAEADRAKMTLEAKQTEEIAKGVAFSPSH